MPTRSPSLPDDAVGVLRFRDAASDHDRTLTFSFTASA